MRLPVTLYVNVPYGISTRITSPCRSESIFENGAAYVVRWPAT